jgi:hypothetical protein
MAGTTGLEPAASAVTGQRSNQLNYVPRLEDQQLTRNPHGYWLLQDLHSVRRSQAEVPFAASTG